jgi:NAD(P)H-hydrate repair Nnr-like enzyme with NAD(P)H-hydrate dehydratase domain
VVEWAAGAQAILMGCGLQHGPPLEEMLDALLGSGLDKPLVLDAAVLGSLRRGPETLRAWRGGAILLPHAREMARLLECEAEEVESDPLAAARRAAKTFGAVTLIKGQYSFIVHPDGRAFRFTGGGVGLATSGSGDALAGIVGGLSARGADPLTAALWGSLPPWRGGAAARPAHRPYRLSRARAARRSAGADGGIGSGSAFVMPDLIRHPPLTDTGRKRR